MAKAKQAKRAAKKPAPQPLRLEYRRPSELADNPANWKTHPQKQLDALADVIAEVGWAGVLLLNEATGRLVDGHARKKLAAKSDAPVPVVIGSWTEEQERLILATLDPIGALAEADSAALASLLAGVSTDSGPINELLESLATAAGIAPEGATAGGGGDDFDATPEEGPTRTKPGELWVIGGKHRLLVGDCTVKGNVARLFAGAKPFLMVTDPPYGVEYDPEWRQDALGPNAERRLGRVANDERADWTDAWKLFPGDVVYCWHAGRHASSVQASLEAAGFEIRLQVVWAKDGHVISRGHYHWQHEPCWYAVRKGSTARWCGDRSQTSLWKIPKKDDSFDSDHGTQKPIECMARPIRNHGAEGDVVYDPFLGSGTTLIAGHRLNRTVYGCELDCRWADTILRRAEAEGLSCEREA